MRDKKLLINEVQRLEYRLSELFRYEHCALFGRARSGISALLQILNVEKDFDFVMQSNISPVLYTVTSMSGARIKLCPINNSTGLADDSALAECVKNGSNFGIVMLANLYGFVQPYPETIQAAKQKSWFVLENDTMATKAVINSNGTRRAIGDALLVSFGSGKSIDGGGGGAVLTNDPNMAKELRAIAEHYPILDATAQAREDQIMSLRLQMRNSSSGNQLTSSKIENILSIEVQNLNYRYPSHLSESLHIAIDEFATNIDIRLTCLHNWNVKLATLGPAISSPTLEQPVPWRAIFLIPGQRENIARQLRSNNIDAGINYPPLWRSFPKKLNDQQHPDSNAWGNDVLNLWLSKDYSENRIKGAFETIEKHLV